MKPGKIIKAVFIGLVVVWAIAIVVFVVGAEYSLAGEVAAAPFVFIWFVFTRIAEVVRQIRNQA